MLDFAFFDADNHYYEPPDAFTRFLDPSMGKRTMQWAEIEGKRRLLVAGRINRFIPNPMFDPVAKPGALTEYFKARAGVNDMRAAFGDLDPLTMRPEYQDRQARLLLMDEQGMEASIMLPTLGVGMEVALKTDLEAMLAAFRAFNRWLDEDWGYNYQDRIYAAPYISLANVDWALEELEYVLARDARVVLLRPGPVFTPQGNTTPGHVRHEAFWERLAEAGVTLVFHGGDSGYQPYDTLWGLSGEHESFRIPALKRLLSASPIRDTISSLFADQLFDRFPRLRVATIETGSEWVAPFIKKLRTAAIQSPGSFGADPYELFFSHVWVSPFFEDDVLGLVKLVGPERVLFGSDFPHAEGLAKPASFEKEIETLPASAIRAIMHDNARDLVTRRP